MARFWHVLALQVSALALWFAHEAVSSEVPLELLPTERSGPPAKSRLLRSEGPSTVARQRSVGSPQNDEADESEDDGDDVEEDERRTRFKQGSEDSEDDIVARRAPGALLLQAEQLDMLDASVSPEEASASKDSNVKLRDQYEQDPFQVDVDAAAQNAAVKAENAEQAERRSAELNAKYEREAAEAIAAHAAKDAASDAQTKEEAADQAAAKKRDAEGHYSKAMEGGSFEKHPGAKDTSEKELQAATKDAGEKASEADAARRRSDDLTARAESNGKTPERDRRAPPAKFSGPPGRPGGTAKNSNSYVTCAKYGETCTCEDGVMLYGAGNDWASTRIDGSKICDASSIPKSTEEDTNHGFGGFREPDAKDAVCQCHTLEWCKAMAHSQTLRAAGLPADVTVDPASRRRSASGPVGSGSHQRRRFCGWGPRPCVWEEWSAFSECPPGCGGTRQRSRRQLHAAANGGDCDGEPEHIEDCPACLVKASEPGPEPRMGEPQAKVETSASVEKQEREMDQEGNSLAQKSDDEARNTPEAHGGRGVIMEEESEPDGERDFFGRADEDLAEDEASTDA